MIGVADVLGTVTGAELEGVGMADGLLELAGEEDEGTEEDETDEGEGDEA